MACVYIPVQNSEEEVRVALDQLPRDASDILDILKAEKAPLDLWLIIAREYFKQGKLEQFRQILEEGSSPVIDEHYANVRYERIAILNALGAYYNYLGKIETKQREKEEHFTLAKQYYNKASKIDIHEPSTWVGKGQLFLTKGEVEQAFAAFKIVLDVDRDNVPALLGQACVEFSRGHYSESLELYKRALQVYPDCPADVILAIGLCRYKLKQYGKAQQAFERVLQLDPENVEALVALAIIDLNTNEASRIRNGMEKMQKAFEIYPSCAMALNYLANHFFFTGQHFLVEQFTETALAIANHGPTKSHSFYNLARSYHSKGDYEKPGLYYMTSTKEANKPHEFVFPYHGLGQVQLKMGDLGSALSNLEKVLEAYPNNCETLKVLGHIYVQLGQAEKAQESLRKATKIDPRDAQAFLDLGELLISTDEGAALDAFKTASILLRKGGRDVPTEVLNNLGVLHFEREEFELAERNFKDALGDGIWLDFIDGKLRCSAIEASASVLQYKDMEFFYQLEREGRSIVLPSKKVTILFNLAGLFEQLHNIEVASALYRLILFKYPDYVDAYLRLASIAKARNYVQLSIELVNDALKLDDKCSNALSMLGELELKNDDWGSEKETFRAAGEATDGKDSYATLSPSLWSETVLSKVDSKKIGDRADGEKLLNEIETISNTLYLNKNSMKNSNSGANARQRSTGKTNLPDPKLKPKSGNEDPTRKDKKSIWSWKTLKAFSHIRNRKFNCCFSLLVHSIKGLPSDLDDFSLSVFWKRRDGLLVTRPKKVVQGKVEFEEELKCTCTVHGRGNGPHHSAKYEAKHFLIYASVYGASEVDLGKHRVDLTRFLPLTLEELEEEKSSGKWATNFKLSGKAKGATMNVSFGYTVLGDNLTASGNHIGDSLKSKQNKYGIGKSEMVFGESGGRSRIQNTKSLPGKMYNDSLVSSRSVDDIKDLHEVIPVPQLELAKSVDVLYKKLDDGKLDTSTDSSPKLDVCTEYSHLMKSDSCPSAPENENGEGDCGTEFSFVEQGIELSSMEQVEKIDARIEVLAEEQVEKINVKVDSSSVGRPEIDNELLMVHEEGSRVDPKKEKHDNYTEELVACNSSSNDYDICTKESILKELESALSCVSELETVALESPEEEQENNSELKSSDESTGKCLPLDLDDEFLEDEFLESDFLRMLGIEQSPSGSSSENEPESPREQLLRQFEDEAVAGGYSLFNFDIEDDDYPARGYNFNVSSEFGVMDTPFDLPSMGNANEGIDFTEDEAVRSKTKAKMLEDLETEVLMHEWGLNEEAFQPSPSSSSHGFGSPADFSREEPFELPPLGEGLGSFIQTKNGGFLRSMNPAIFQNTKSGGNLIMQVSTPVVVPAEMGSGIMEILQRLASVGIEKLSMQANKLMPLEDITGKTMQQVAWEAIPTLEGSNRQCMPQSEPVFEQDSFGKRKNSMGRSSGSRHEKFSPNSMRGEPETEYVSLEDVAPLALDKIEALSIEGLRIQSGMSEDEAPSNISAQPIGEFSALRGKGIDISGSLGLEGTAGLQLLDIKDNGDDVDGLMGLSLSLDEWMRLDSGELDDEEIISEHTSKILAAHHANSLDFIRGGTKGDRRRGKSSGRKCGLLGNNFTVALMVQLRDPLRNYEPVGAPMLSLIQVERVFIPPKPKIYSTVSEIRNNYNEDDLESVTRVEKKEEPEEKASEQKGIPQFRITEVHVAGIKSEPNKKLWGTSTSSQQKSGSRWLLANGMGKSKKHPFLKTKAAPKSLAPEPTKVQPPGNKDKDSLWSISSGAMWKAFSALNPHARNPNVLFPNENLSLR